MVEANEVDRSFAGAFKATLKLQLRAQRQP